MSGAQTGHRAGPRRAGRTRVSRRARPPLLVLVAGLLLALVVGDGGARPRLVGPAPAAPPAASATAGGGGEASSPGAAVRTGAGSGGRTAAASAGTRVATFNVLGHSHRNDSRDRTRRALDLLEDRGVGIVALQELQRENARAWRDIGGYALFQGDPGAGRPDMAVAWNPDRWAFVDGNRVAMPFMRWSRRMPVVRLRHRASGAEVVVLSVHNAPGGQWSRQRARAADRHLRIVERLAGRGYPVLLMGDVNSRVDYFCRVTADGVVHAANGGSTGEECSRPPGPPVDWVFGSGGVQFRGYRADRTPMRRGTSDHPLVYADARAHAVTGR